MILRSFQGMIRCNRNVVWIVERIHAKMVVAG
jgi:hypothetical protein